MKEPRCTTPATPTTTANIVNAPKNNPGGHRAGTQVFTAFSHLRNGYGASADSGSTCSKLIPTYRIEAQRNANTYCALHSRWDRRDMPPAPLRSPANTLQKDPTPEIRRTPQSRTRLGHRAGAGGACLGGGVVDSAAVGTCVAVTSSVAATSSGIYAIQDVFDEKR